MANSSYLGGHDSKDVSSRKPCDLQLIKEIVANADLLLLDILSVVTPHREYLERRLDKAWQLFNSKEASVVAYDLNKSIGACKSVESYCSLFRSFLKYAESDYMTGRLNDFLSRLKLDYKNVDSGYILYNRIGVVKLILEFESDDADRLVTDFVLLKQLFKPLTIEGYSFSNDAQYQFIRFCDQLADTIRFNY